MQTTFMDYSQLLILNKMKARFIIQNGRLVESSVEYFERFTLVQKARSICILKPVINNSEVLPVIIGKNKGITYFHQTYGGF